MTSEGAGGADGGPRIRTPGSGSARAADALGPAAFAAATADGARLRVPDALRYGLAATADQTASDPFPDWAGKLRPAVVARLRCRWDRGNDRARRRRSCASQPPSPWVR